MDMLQLLFYINKFVVSDLTDNIKRQFKQVRDTIPPYKSLT